MATRNSLPSALNVNVADDVAIREGEQAATRITRGAHLSDQLKVGVALMALSRIALKEAGANARMGRPYNEAFARQLGRHPKLEAVYGHTRAAALWCVENWTDVQAYLAKLEKDDPRKLQLLGVRGLRDLVSAEINAAHRATDEMPEPHEPAPRQLTPAEQLNFVLVALRDSGLRYDNGLIEISDLRAYRSWQKYQRDRAAEIAKLDEEPQPGDDQPF